MKVRILYTMCYTDYLGTSMETTAVFVDYKIKSCISSFLSEQLFGDRPYSRTKDYLETHIKIAKYVGIK